MSDEAEPRDRQPPARKRSQPLLLLAGILLLGAAFLLLLFGSDLFGEDLPTSGALAEVPQLSAGTLIPTAVAGDGSRAPAVGEAAPDFTLSDLDGNRVTLADLRGRPIIINFWATWCGPCQIEMPALQNAYETRREEGLEVLAVNREEDPETVRAFFYDELDLSFTPLLDPDLVVANRYQIFNLPTTYFVDERGIITGVHRGPLTDSQITEYLEN